MTGIGLPKSLRTIMRAIESTPLHPQWLALRQQPGTLEHVSRISQGVVLDVGCGHQESRAAVGPDCEYIGLDYYATATAWYGTRPQLFGDAERLPIASESVQTVLLLDVLEHLPHPERCLAEIARILRSGGTALVQVPFMYPIHDKPLDFQRWTAFGLEKLAQTHGFTIIERIMFGRPLETAGLLLNIALCKSCINWLTSRHLAAAFGLALPIVVPVINVVTLILSRFGPDDPLMPHGYRLELRKN